MKKYSRRLNLIVGDNDLKFELLSISSQMLEMNVSINGINLCDVDNAYYIFSLANEVRININYLIKVENWFKIQPKLSSTSVEESVKIFLETCHDEVASHSMLDWGPPLNGYKCYLVPYLDELYLSAVPVVEKRYMFESCIISRFNRFKSIQKLIVLQSHLMELLQECIQGQQ